MVSGQIATAAIALIVLFVFWMFVGVLSYASGVAIYDNFPSNPFSPSSTFAITFQNNAANLNPLLVPLYLASIQTSNATCTYSGGGPCNGVLVDVGKIEPGGSATLTFMLTPMRQDFGITAAVYLNLWNALKISAGSKSIHFTYLANGTYLMQ